MGMNNNYCIVITGATGVGKTDFSLQLGNDLPIEIVNADFERIPSDVSLFGMSVNIISCAKKST